VSDPVRVAPVGDSAVSLELGDAIEPALAARVRSLDQDLRERPFPGFRESVPSYRALLVVYDPRQRGFGEVRAELLRRAQAPARPASLGRLHQVPTRYGGEAGCDLPALARARGLSQAQAVALHTGSEYTALMVGFLPGFAYLGLLPETLDTPRLATPRTRVPAGAVAVAGRQTGIYPTASPGGWNLIGRTTLRLFDPARDPPALILPGDRVRFVATDALPEPAPGPPIVEPGGNAALEVLDPGLLTTIQDEGRRGFRRMGVSWAGPLDARAHEAARRGVGNPEGAAGLECTVAGPTLRVLAPVRFAVAGADLGAVLQRADLGAWPVPLGVPVLARPGNVLAFTERRAGCRASVAFAGGIDVPQVLGSRATDLAGGFGGLGGRALRSGDRLSLGPAGGVPREQPRLASPATTVTLRVVLGPQEDHFPESALACFLSEVFRLAPASDRVGCRLTGATLAHRGLAEIVTDGLVPGVVQVPPDGQPIVALAEGPTTGGYPKIATVVSADLPLLAQLLPGEGRVRFAALSVEEAQRALR
jgi:KipI family sensor histidine kinase inhibitor